MNYKGFITLTLFIMPLNLLKSCTFRFVSVRSSSTNCIGVIIVLPMHSIDVFVGIKDRLIELELLVLKILDGWLA